MDATLNVRLDAVAKRRGDAVLKQHHLSTSEAVRNLWAYMAKTHTVPECIRPESSREAAKTQKKLVLASMLGFAESPYSTMTDEELRDLCASKFE